MIADGPPAGSRHADQRVLPLVEIDRATIEAIFEPITGGTALGAIAPIEGGLVNTLLRVTCAGSCNYALRIYPDDTLARAPAARFERETAILAALADQLPVPRPIVVDATRAVCAWPYIIYPWIDGITLNEYRLGARSGIASSLAKPLGRVLATIAAAHTTATLPPLGHLSISSALVDAEARLAASRARDRLGGVVANALRRTLDAVALSLDDRHDARQLVHGDFGGRNILVESTDGTSWKPAGVLDWEAASTGSPLWDIGSLFRYPGRFGSEFRAAFERGYLMAGGVLPDDWWRLARLIDATRLVEVLGEDHDLPTVFDDCRAIIGSLI